MAAFIVISVILHIFSIFAIVILYQRRSLERLNLPTLQDDVETIYQSMESFIDEIEKENEALYKKMKSYIKNKEIQLENRIQHVEEKLAQATMQMDQFAQEEKKITKQGNEQEENTLRVQQVIDLYHQGFSVEQISKTLQIGKGEIHLIINMVNNSRI